MRPTNPLIDIIVDATVALSEAAIRKYQETLEDLRGNRAVVAAQLAQLDALIAEGQAHVSNLRRDIARVRGF